MLYVSTQITLSIPLYFKPEMMSTETDSGVLCVL